MGEKRKRNVGLKILVIAVAICFSLSAVVTFITGCIMKDNDMWQIGLYWFCTAIFISIVITVITRGLRFSKRFCILLFTILILAFLIIGFALCTKLYGANANKDVVKYYYPQYVALIMTVYSALTIFISIVFTTYLKRREEIPALRLQVSDQLMISDCRLTLAPAPDWDPADGSVTGSDPDSDSPAPSPRDCLVYKTVRFTSERYVCLMGIVLNDTYLLYVRPCEIFAKETRKISLQLCDGIKLLLKDRFDEIYAATVRLETTPDGQTLDVDAIAFANLSLVKKAAKDLCNA